MLIKEYRVVLPLTVEEYQIGQLWSTAEMSKNETGGGEGIEVVKNEPFENRPLLGTKFSSGQYTYKIYHVASKVPAFIRLLIPKGAMEVHEEAWNAYPYSKTIISIPGFMTVDKAFIEIATKCEPGRPTVNNVRNREVSVLAFCCQKGLDENPAYMKEKFSIVIDSLHVGDDGCSENAHELPPEKLKEREVIRIDIANDPIPPSDYKEDQDPAKFKSQKTGRGPLAKDWISKMEPIMTCYKLVSCEFKWFGLQNRIEKFIQTSERRLFTVFHRQVFCYIDKWHGLNMDDIRRVEEQTKKELDEQRKKGQVRGMKATE